MSKRLDEAERHLTADPPRFDLAVACVIRHIRATPPPHVEGEKAAGEAEASDDDLDIIAGRAAEKHLESADVISGATYRAMRRATYEHGVVVGKASAAREVERLRAQLAAWEPNILGLPRDSPAWRAIPPELRPEKA